LLTDGGIAEVLLDVREAGHLDTIEFLQQEWINDGNFMALGDERDPDAIGVSLEKSQPTVVERGA
jgi:hypothetical protein